MPLATRKCATCDQPFEPGSGRQLYCASCGRRGRATCERCGRDFVLKANTRGRFCSRECWGLTSSNPDTRRRPCQVCGTMYKPTFAAQKTCSRECGAAIQRRPDLTCPVCGKTYNSRHYSRTCSYECAGKLRQLPRLNCERCGKPIESRFRARRFCSVECRAAPLGTKLVTRAGYIRIKVGVDYPGADKTGYVFEHRYVMEQRLGRTLHSHESVHHKNAERADNRDENLELRVGRHGAGATGKHCPTCTCFDH